MNFGCWGTGLGMIKQYVDLLTGCKIKLSCAWERLTIDVHCFYNKKTEHPLQDTLHGRSGEIRTRGLLNPIQARYQAALHPD